MLELRLPYKIMLDFAAITKIGGREVNEDSISVVEHRNRYGFLVCDGLGGYGMGDVASKTVSDAFEQFLKTFAQDDEAFLPGMFENAQDKLLAEQKTLKRKMCTTAVALYIASGKAYIGHIGDSRLYAFENGRHIFRTIDHSLVQMLAMRGEISEEEMAHHSQRNKLLRAIGSNWEKPMYTLATPIRLQGNQAFLLCSDGFWEWIDQQKVCDCFSESKNAEQWLSKMVRIIENNHDIRSADNYSAIAVISTEDL